MLAHQILELRPWHYALNQGVTNGRRPRRRCLWTLDRNRLISENYEMLMDLFYLTAAAFLAFMTLVQRSRRPTDQQQELYIILRDATRQSHVYSVKRLPRLECHIHTQDRETG